MTKDDKEIREILKSAVDDAPENPWFVRKVLNRLPPRRNPGAIIEKTVVLLVVIGVITGVILQAVHMGRSQVIYVKDLVLMGAYMLAFLGLAAWIIYPLVKE